MTPLTIRVYRLLGWADPPTLGDDANVELVAVGHMISEDSQELGFDQLAAKAWVKCVGYARRDFLDRLGAPEHLLEAQIDPEQVASELSPAPSAFAAEHGYLLDNQCETWLICITEEAESRSSFFLPKVRLTAGMSDLYLQQQRGFNPLLETLFRPLAN